MANQIKKKYIADNAIDGEKLLLEADQTIRKSDGSGGEIDVIQTLNDADAAEASARQNADSELQDNIDAEKARVDAILTASEADKDSFAEIVSLVNSIDTENDQAFAGYVASNDARSTQIETSISQEILDRTTADDQLQSNIDAEESARLAADDQLQSNIDAEIADRESGDQNLQSQITAIQGSSNVIFEDNAAVYADGTAPKEDPLGKDGWYYKNDGQNIGSGGLDKVNWYFFDESVQTELLGSVLNGYAVGEIRGSGPFHLALYTVPQGDGNDAGSWYRSRMVFVPADGSYEQGKKYLFVTNLQDTPANLYPDLERIEMVLSQVSTVGPLDSSEQVLTGSLGTNSASQTNDTEILVTNVGYVSTVNGVVDARFEIRENFSLAGIKESLSEEALKRQSEDERVLSESKSYTDAKVSELVDSAPEVLDTLKELSDALDGDENFATTVANNIGQVSAKVDSEAARIEGLVSDEEAAREAADQSLQQQISDISSGVMNALSQEVSDRESADSALQSASADHESRITVLEQTKEVIEVDSLGAAPSLGLVGKIYVAKDSNKIYRWDQGSGSSLVFDKTVGAGETYETLEAAIAAAADGENILVKAGTYSVASTINVNKKVKIVGEDKDTVIFETVGSTDDPTAVFNISVDDVALAKLSIKHKKTSNSSIETAIVASGGGWPQTRIKNFLLEDCYVEFVETGVAVRAEGWCVRDCTLAYGTGSASNSARAIIMYGTKGDSFIKSNVLKNDIIDTSSFRPFYLSSTNGSNPNETSEGKLIIEGMTQLGSLSQFFNQDNLQSAGAGTFELQIKNNTINESNLFAGFASYVQNAGDMFSSITLSGNSISNNHNDTGGKGLYGVYGNTDFRSSALVVHADNNTLGQEVYRDGWESVDGSLIGKEVAVPAFTVTKDAIIPASGDAPSIAGGPSGQYVELSESFDSSELETELDSLDSRLDTLEAKSFAKGSLVVGAELAYIDLDREYETMLSVSVGRLAVHEGEDYTVSVVGGVTRLTWIGSFVNPGGEEAIETGDKVFWSGSY